MTSSAPVDVDPRGTHDPPPPPAALRPGRTPYVLSGALATVATVAAGFSLSFPSLLAGVAVGNGNLRGTAAALLVVGLPTLIVAMGRAARGSARGLVVWLGTLSYFLYQAVLFSFATPLNNLFLVYVAFLSVAVWSTISLVRSIDITGFGRRIGPQMPMRTIAAVGLVLATLNAAAWLKPIIPAVLSAEPRSLLDGTGLLTNVVYIQDLAVWLPLLTVGAIAMWRGKDWGVLITGSMLAMFILECISIATDQWFGSRADPLSDGASMSMVPAFAIAAVVLVLPFAWFAHNLHRPAGPKS